MTPPRLPVLTAKTPTMKMMHAKWRQPPTPRVLARRKRRASSHRPFRPFLPLLTSQKMSLTRDAPTLCLLAFLAPSL
jgi:hypothetical protein